MRWFHSKRTDDVYFLCAQHFFFPAITKRNLDYFTSNVVGTEQIYYSFTSLGDSLSSAFGLVDCFVSNSYLLFKDITIPGL